MAGSRTSFRAGRASRIEDLGDGTILRLGGRPSEEARLMGLASEHGIRVPRVHEVRDDGLVMERIDGRSMGDRLRRRPWQLRHWIRRLAELHERLHLIELDGGRLVHFDLHPDNVLLQGDQPVIIDWTNAHGGDPDGDLAMTWLIFETSSGLPGRLAARVFRSAVGREPIARGLSAAVTFRLADPHVTDAERERVRRATGIG